MSANQSAVIALTEAEFDNFAQASTLPVLADFWASWCSPCRFLAPLFEKFAREFSDKAVFVKINRDEAPGLRARFQIDSIPRLILIKDGNPVAVEVGLSEYNRQHARVKKMFGIKAAGRPSNREKKFRVAVAAAGENYRKLIGDTQDVYFAKYGPIAMKVHADRKVNNEALHLGTITADQHKTRAEQIDGEFELASAAIKDLADAYNGVRVPAEILYKADILSATDLLFPLAQTPAEVSVEAEVQDGAFCAIGDTTCGGG